MLLLLLVLVMLLLLVLLYVADAVVVAVAATAAAVASGFVYIQFWQPLVTLVACLMVVLVLKVHGSYSSSSSC